MEAETIVTDDSDKDTVSNCLKIVSFLSIIDKIILRNLQDIANATNKLENKIDKICGVSNDHNQRLLLQHNI